MSYINSALHIYSNGYNSTSQSYSTLLDHSIAQISKSYNQITTNNSLSSI